MEPNKQTDSDRRLFTLTLTGLFLAWRMNVKRKQQEQQEALNRLTPEQLAEYNLRIQREKQEKDKIAAQTPISTAQKIFEIILFILFLAFFAAIIVMK